VSVCFLFSDVGLSIIATSAVRFEDVGAQALSNLLLLYKNQSQLTNLVCTFDN
jgi:hypothetical protein